ncbi:nitrogenase molybdenum-iron protein alpha chain [Clostridium tyrobutyricum]|jgi:nitrogenase molybdenum-iron protein alpha chain|uniref:Nitrogenase protein alpha chain n=1 Tax=Clostridium tyrobutyricum DIVETGP TaxID=1408889 RepID=W6N602_CLOTY|nr:nitrogenase molybdenum-iron protein alpha chain [Clostridium tyrobutyricum]AND86261.1 nitrogenase molybdenum-iron protein subunit alpha [Clostridium tyrobutyricum]ANP70751.1 nitrogenase molybdenum-iron protein alpha chain [Clostridium tyrobutyricum]MBR9648163.1 nitrogenase molybdenum-iron protein alpha chain [Clostridium tyrobutyricum]MBV4423413.1 nitrogenase molybdenum-iron protein alpha chain [Clostridium tyrobutyricum]MBV4426104.1 nitrogenase molybdenum-iron protein alpha chain [Clostrid
MKKEWSQIIDEVLEPYPSKTYKKRKKHMVVKTKEDSNPVIAANIRTIPGVITARGCCYAGCKGVVMGPIKDMVHITHGPVGCSFYTWGGRRFKSKASEGGQNFNEYVFGTDMQEQNIVFGGVGKLQKAIDEAVEIFHPKAVGIYATCPVGLIGDDIQAVASASQKKYGIPVLAFSCEGYKGVTQSAGHHIANNTVMSDIIGTGTHKHKQHSVNVLGEYNIGGDSWEIDRVLKKIGYNVVATLTGDASYEDIQNAYQADVNLVQCYRSINYIAGMMETKYGIPWIKANFIGVEATARTLRDLAKVFDEPELYKRTEEVIAEEIGAIEADIQYYREKLEGKTACLYVGGLRAQTYQELLKDLGVKTILAGHEFGHRDDYEGSSVIPTIKVDADSKNIPEITVTKDEEKYRVILPKDRAEALKAEGVQLDGYTGLVAEMEDDTLMIDDINGHELEKFIKELHPDMFLTGVKEKYVIEKMGVLSRQLHSYDYTGPYAGFKGAVIFARELARGVYTPAWKYLTPPWKKQPLLDGKVEEEIAAGGER